MTTTLHGIDISHWQAGLQLAKTDAQFALFKATDGTSYVDACCDGFVTQAKRAGLPWGVYHFWQGNPTAEADHFVDSVAGYVGDAMLVLDFEGAHATSPSAAKTWLDRVYDRTGVRPLIYMSQSVTHQFDWTAVAKDYALWVARYGSSSYGDTGAWAAPAMWQYTDAHKTGGYSVDGDYFYGDEAAWAAFASGGNAHTDNDTGGDWFDMATKKDLEDAVLAVLKSSDGRKAIANAAWNTDGVIEAPDGEGAKDNPYWTGRGWLGSIRTQAMTKDE